MNAINPTWEELNAIVLDALAANGGKLPVAIQIAIDARLPSDVDISTDASDWWNSKAAESMLVQVACLHRALTALDAAEADEIMDAGNIAEARSELVTLANSPDLFAYAGNLRKLIADLRSGWER